MFFGDFRAASVAALLVWIGFAVPSVAAAEVFLAGPSDDVEARINALQPGDELVLSGGMYTLSERFSFAIVGTETAPITIRAADGEVPHLHRPNDNREHHRHRPSGACHDSRHRILWRLGGHSD